jgi:multicomponent Na+:H+ antiporter subunit D
MDLLLLIPLILPLAAAALSMLAMKNIALQRGIALVAGLGLLAAGIALMIAVWEHGVLVTELGNWPAPFGIVLACDLLGAAMTAITGLMGLAVIVYSFGSIDEDRERAGYWPLTHMLLMGVSGSFLTGDLFNLYVWFEVMLMASFALLAIGGGRAQFEGSVKYFVLSMLSSVVFLTAIGIAYGLTGTLNMAEMAVRLPAVVTPVMRDVLGMLLFTAFGLKAAVFPLFAWLPASYHTPPPPVSAIFAGLLTKVGVYAMIRTFTLLLPLGPDGSMLALQVLPWVAGLTMLIGVLGAAAQDDVRRILSFHIVSQIGYMVLGLAIATPLALAGAVFYLVHHIVTKTNLFLVAGVIRRLRGTEALDRLGGLYRTRTGLAILFLIPALSLAGIPPLSGFWAKMIVFKAGIVAEAWVLVVVAAVVSLLTIYSMTKIWSEAFWKEAPEGASAEAVADPARGGLASMLVPIAVLAAVTVVMGLMAGPVFTFAERAAEQVIAPAAYIEAVLGSGR